MIQDQDKLPCKLLENSRQNNFSSFKGETMKEEKEKLLEAVNRIINIIDQLPIQKSSPKNDNFASEVNYVRKKLENIKNNLTKDAGKRGFFPLESVKMELIALAGTLHRAIRSCKSLELMGFMALISEATIEI